MAKDLTIERIFDAPVEKVWEMWTTSEGIMKWWGPKNFTSPECKIDLRVGGKYIFCMRGAIEPGGEEKNLYSTGTYKEIVPMKKIVTTDSFADEEGNVVSPAKYGMPEDFPEELEVTIEFEEVGNKTKMVLTHLGMPEGQMKEMTGSGWNESFDKLAEALK